MKRTISFFAILGMIILFKGGSCKKEPSIENMARYTGEVTITTCREIKNNLPSGSSRAFSLEEMVYAHVLWKKLQGSHKTMAVFIDPKGQPRFPAEVQINDAKGAAVTWYWLKISEVNPDWARGRWIARIFIDDLLAGTAEIILQ